VLDEPEVTDVTVVKAARIGFSTALIAALGNYVQRDPSPSLVVLPAHEDAKHFAVQAEQVFDASPDLAGLMKDDRADRSTMMTRRFPGGSVTYVSAGAPRNLRARTARLVLIDEADGMKPTTEGDPVRLAATRASTYANRKIIVGSTPVYTETSVVLDRYSKSDQRIFEIPCSGCGEFFELLWQHIRWEKDADGNTLPDSAHAVAPCCGTIITEREKYSLVEQGRWRATRPDVKGHAGFKINALVSSIPAARWPLLVKEFVEATRTKDHGLLQPFTNLVLGEGWSLDDGEALPPDELAARAEAIGLDNLPAEVLLMTAGADVQKDRIEIGLYGHAEAGTTFCLAHEIVWGDPDDEATWDEVAEVIQRSYQHPLGGRIAPAMTCVDSGGHSTDAVYRFASKWRNVWAIKGMAGARPAFEVRNKNRAKKGARLALVGVDNLKHSIFRRLRRGPQEAGGFRFSEDLPGDWYGQLCSEKLVIRYSQGRKVERWLPVAENARNEALDVTVYGLAALAALGRVNWQSHLERLSQGPAAAAANSQKRLADALASF
jgi:phage terminase large subunit GpA-like protein